jgi:hypothetical protein
MAFIKRPFLASAAAANGVQQTYPLKSLRWENFRWTGLGQKT